MSNLNNLKSLKNCVCRNLRMTTRITTQHFDQIFQTVGLTTPQFSLLSDITAHENIAISEVAEILLMDQTTLTRNIEILRKKGYVNVRTDGNDSRRKCISLSNVGEEILNEAIPVWNNVQSLIFKEIGAEKFTGFLETLTQIQTIINKISS
ncbi:organic hydroperoxide resistance transcriptional regulator [Clostridium puniceum]|uniref:Organic hydroperoxide resistance transcriptional regulator n=1 Tax=Clostridium puniceum TaxID=29367 RepID=A0A1S8TE41_9CLOT|nr:MarR family winged helix-turn-helix transcriptional regulator [Clostridium puniceum]OOM76060.1 organic hydroperoxide resistance transcriptional regulator [Clostridium puniceum]